MMEITFQPRSVLVLDDTPEARSALRRTLQDLGYTAFLAGNIGEAKEILEKTSVEVALVDIILDHENGNDLVRWGLERKRIQRAYALTGQQDAETVLSAIRAGCRDVLLKPFTKEQLREMISSPEPPSTTEWRVKCAPDIVGEHPKLLDVLQWVNRVAPTNISILLTGESGTGKELFAQAIHRASRQSNKPFEAINCAGIPDTLIESELFGHTKGAFTGANSHREGRILSANGGTLFLDELGDMPLTAQAKLLRVLQEGKLTPVGSDRSIDVNVRVVAATNKNLQEEIRRNAFRNDLFFRINQFTIKLPPLRERGEDILSIAASFIRKANLEFGTNVKGIEASAERQLIRYQWPGNIRELYNLIRSAVVIRQTDLLSVHDLRFQETIQEEMRTTEFEPEEIPRDRLNLKTATDELERKYILKALQYANHNRTEAAALLGLNRTTLLEKMRKLGLS
jgi:DNA-binding NtrC family response regulator